MDWISEAQDMDKWHAIFFYGNDPSDRITFGGFFD
jgi:hypothetical protein